MAKKTVPSLSNRWDCWKRENGRESDPGRSRRLTEQKHGDSAGYNLLLICGKLRIKYWYILRVVYCRLRMVLNDHSVYFCVCLFSFLPRKRDTWSWVSRKDTFYHRVDTSQYCLRCRGHIFLCWKEKEKTNWFYFFISYYFLSSFFPLLCHVEVYSQCFSTCSTSAALISSATSTWCDLHGSSRLSLLWLFEPVLVMQLPCDGSALHYIVYL